MKTFLQGPSTHDAYICIPRSCSCTPASAPAPFPKPQTLTGPITGLLSGIVNGVADVGSLTSTIPAVLTDLADVLTAADAVELKWFRSCAD